MFGYIRPLKGELKVKELNRYRAEYCALCKAIGRYGLITRNVLSYDCAFLALLVDALNAQSAVNFERCAYNPLKKKPVAARSEPLFYAAQINVLLTYHNLADDWQDSRSIKAALGRLILRRAAIKCSRHLPDVNARIIEQLKKLSALEKENCALPDAVADAFGQLLRAVFENAPAQPDNKTALGVLGYHLGRWIYFMDAFEDRMDDKKAGGYNVFNLRYNSPEALRDGASFLLYSAMHTVIDAYELLELQENKPLLDNILYGGCCEQTALVLNDRRKEIANESI